MVSLSIYLVEYLLFIIFHTSLFIISLNWFLVYVWQTSLSYLYSLFHDSWKVCSLPYSYNSTLKYAWYWCIRNFSYVLSSIIMSYVVKLCMIILYIQCIEWSYDVPVDIIFLVILVLFLLGVFLNTVLVVFYEPSTSSSRL